MRFLIIIFFIVYAFGDVKRIVNKIEDIENIKYNFIPYNNYNPFEGEEFKPKNKGVKKEKKTFVLKIDAIFNDKVYINGKWYKVGDEIYGNKILKIYHTKVVFIKNGKIFEIPIGMKILKVN